jgi:hypothetical protein
MWVEGVPYLISISSPLCLVLISSKLQKPRSESAVINDILLHIGGYTKYNYKVICVLSDGESGINAAEPRLLADRSIRLNTCAAGQHVPVVERSIRDIKNAMRSVLHGLSGEGIELPLPSWLEYLIAFVINRINMRPTAARDDPGTCPREALIGIKVDYNRDVVRTGFLDYILCTLPNTNNSMQARVEECLALYPTGNAQGSIIKCISLTTGHIVTRDQFKSAAMPERVRLHINALAAGYNAAKGGRKVPWSSRLHQVDFYRGFHRQLVREDIYYHQQTFAEDVNGNVTNNDDHINVSPVENPGMLTGVESQQSDDNAGDAGEDRSIEDIERNNQDMTPIDLPEEVSEGQEYLEEQNLDVTEPHRGAVEDLVEEDSVGPSVCRGA